MANSLGKLLILRTPLAICVSTSVSAAALAQNSTSNDLAICISPDTAEAPIAGCADAASEITMIGRTQADVETYRETETRTVRAYPDLLKPIAGVAANDFDQSGVGFGLTLRGFTERSNGGNVALFIDGVPVNQLGHRSANGNGDLSPLLPELVDSLVLIRGPFDVRAGPFALAGSVRFETRDKPILAPFSRAAVTNSRKDSRSRHFPPGA